MNCEVISVPQNNPCVECKPCMRMRLMELGFIEGTEIEITEKINGMYIVDVISDSGSIEQRLALRKDEMDRICYKLK
jgi:Fe2+ transport system protein FeoA